MLSPPKNDGHLFVRGPSRGSRDVPRVAVQTTGVIGETSSPSPSKLPDCFLIPSCAPLLCFHLHLHHRQRAATTAPPSANPRLFFAISLLASLCQARIGVVVGRASELHPSCRVRKQRQRRARRLVLQHLDPPAHHRLGRACPGFYSSLSSLDLLPP